MPRIKSPRGPIRERRFDSGHVHNTSERPADVYAVSDPPGTVIPATTNNHKEFQ